jgi:hypothetical protein
MPNVWQRIVVGAAGLRRRRMRRVRSASSSTAVRPSGTSRIDRRHAGRARRQPVARRGGARDRAQHAQRKLRAFGMYRGTGSATDAGEQLHHVVGVLFRFDMGIRRTAQSLSRS